MPETHNYSDKIEHFKSHILPASSLLIITHDYPDPDCLASAFGISHLVATYGISSSVITFGGFVGRAENRAMIQLCDIHTIPFMLVDLLEFDRRVLVDSFPAIGNISLPKSAPVDAVLDHHPHKQSQKASYFFDIREDLGATSTLVTKYLLEARCAIPPKLATALFYGIKTDTNDMARNANEEDLECYKILFDIMDHRLLSQIENPDREAEYYQILHRATDFMVTYGNVGHTHLSTVTTPDHIAEVADFLHPLEGLEWMICSAIFNNQVFFSIRSKKLEKAGAMAEKIANLMGGQGGGHYTMAAGRIPLNGKPKEETLDMFVKVFRDVLGVNNSIGEDLLHK